MKSYYLVDDQLLWVTSGDTFINVIESALHSLNDIEWRKIHVDPLSIPKDEFLSMLAYERAFNNKTVSIHESCKCIQ